MTSISKWSWKYGIVGGLLAGLVFALAEMIAGWVTTGSAISPLQMIASIPLQQQPATIPITTAIFAGVLFHLLLSMIFGVIIAYVIASARAFRRSRTAMIWTATVAGFVLWAVNFYVLAPIVNVPWFATQTNPLLQFIWHTFAFGTVLGLYLGAVRHELDPYAATTTERRHARHTRTT